MTASKSQTLRHLLYHTGELVQVRESASILQVTPHQAAQTLARWAKQGWLTRIRRGLYMAAPLHAASHDSALEDPWVLVPEIFAPAYIGGWTAAEYWDFTEQIFRDLCVVTQKKDLIKKQTLHYVPFVMTHFPARLHFGTQSLWRHETQVMISDPHKTILDMLYQPSLGGGAIHVVASVRAYFEGSHFRQDTLLQYATQYQSGAVCKRLGYLAETLLGIQNPIALFCKAHITKGTIQFDPSVKASRRVHAWGLTVPDHLFL